MITSHRNVGVGKSQDRRGKNTDHPTEVSISILIRAITLTNHSTDDYPDDGSAAPGAGSSLWGRLTSAAGTLGVDVSKAWATNVAVYAGEGMLFLFERLYYLQKR